jgi:hypothetical protein
LRQKLRHGRARRLDAVFMRIDNIAQATRIGTSRPNRNAAHLAKVRLTASWIEPPTERQTAATLVWSSYPYYDLQPAIRYCGLDETGWTGVS